MNNNYPFETFKYKTLGDLKNKINQMHLEIPISPEVEILQQRVKFKNIYFPNRFAVHPMEGFDSENDGSPTDLTFRRYKRYAEGGTGLIWFEATAISEEGRSNPHQLFLHEKNKSKFKELVSKTREICNQTLKTMGFKNQCVLILQLNHSGRYSKKGDKRYPIRACEIPELDNAMSVSKKDGIIITDVQLENLENLWKEKVLLAQEVGFDGADIKACHGYLIGELLGARNRENSQFGGLSLKQRAKFFLNIVKESINETKDTDFIITSRLGAYDGMPYPNGFGIKEIEGEKYPATVDLSEPLELINELYKYGVRLINISAGDPHYKPFITRPFDTPMSGKGLSPEHPLVSVNRILKLSTEIKKAIPQDMVIIGSGYSYLRQFAGHVAAALIHEKKVDLCGFGRMAFANPNFPKQILTDGMIDKKQTCITCSKCSEQIKLGNSTGCLIRDTQYKNRI